MFSRSPIKVISLTERAVDLTKAWMPLSKRNIASQQHIKYNTSRKNVYCFTLIRLFLKKLWRCVPWRAKITLQQHLVELWIFSFIDLVTLILFCKTKICDLERKILVKKKVFSFEIAVCYPLRMQILESLHKLCKEFAGYLFRKAYYTIANIAK
jgi:hypothetical protein